MKQILIICFAIVFAMPSCAQDQQNDNKTTTYYLFVMQKKTEAIRLIKTRI